MSLDYRFLYIRNDVTVRKLIIKGNIETLEPLHIGGKKGIYENYIDVLKGADGMPYIPGSSLKGVLRSLVEIEYSNLGIEVCPGSELDITNLANDPELIEDVKSRYGSYLIASSKFKVETCGKKYERDIDDLSRAIGGKLQEALEKVDRKLCEACKVFGTSGFLGSLTVYDAVPKSVKLGTRPSLNTYHRKFFKIEYVESGSVFNFELSMRNPANYMIGAIILALKDLSEGRYKIGGLRSRGFGLVTLKNLSMIIRNFSDLSYEKGEKLTLKPLSAKDVPVYLESETISDPEFFKKAEAFINAMRSALKKGEQYGSR